MLNTPESVLTTWINGVNALDVPVVLALYHDEALLLPTFSEKCFKGPDEIVKYFEGMGRHDSVRVEYLPDTTDILSIGDQHYVAGGLYDWHFVTDGEPAIFRARYTFVIDLKSERPIQHHHSSVNPISKSMEAKI